MRELAKRRSCTTRSSHPSGVQVFLCRKLVVLSKRRHPLRELRREQQPQSAFVFCSERGGPMTRSNVAKMIETAGDRAELPHCHPHMLRHTAGHLLADAGHDTRRPQLWLGYSDIKHTARYSELSAKPFREQITKKQITDRL